MRHLLALLLFLFATASIVDRANAEASDAVKNASKVILNGKQITEPSELMNRSHWVYKNEIYICTTATASVLEADGQSTPRAAINCNSQLELAKIFVNERNFEEFKELNDNALLVFHKENTPPFSSIEIGQWNYTFHAGIDDLYVCSRIWSFLVCRYNHDLKAFDILY